MQKKLINIIGGIILLTVLGYSFLKHQSDVQGLKQQMLFTTGRVETTKIGKSNYFIIYTFSYQGKFYLEYKSIFGINIANANKFLVGKTFPLIISKKEPQNSELLLFKKDFEKYGLTYPDSLKWVCDSLQLKDCK